jgi:Family of unknown function (DUF6804)
VQEEMGSFMLTKVAKWVSVAMLLLAALRLPSESFQILLQSVVCVSGFVVAAQAVRASKYIWAAGFVAIAVVFNPVVPLLLSRRTFVWLDLVSLMTFLVSLVFLKRQPRLSMPSITNRMPRSQSL